MSASEKLKAVYKAINAEHSQAGMSAVQLARDTAIDALPEIVAVLEAAKEKVAEGCHDTCSRALDISYECDCGYVTLDEAMAALEAKLDG